MKDALKNKILRMHPELSAINRESWRTDRKWDNAIQACFYGF